MRSKIKSKTPKLNNRNAHYDQEKLNRFHKIMMDTGKSINLNLKQSKAQKNPDILEKLVTYCDINEIGTNYPKELYDPSTLNEKDFYDEIPKQIHEEIENRERERSNRTTIDFTRSTSDSTSTNQTTSSNTSSTTSAPPPGKSKWDVVEKPKDERERMKAEAIAPEKNEDKGDGKKKDEKSKMASSAYSEYM